MGHHSYKSVRLLARPGDKLERRNVFIRVAIVTAIFLFSWWSYYGVPSLLYFRGSGERISPMDSHGRVFMDFEDIPPSEKLEWHPCFIAPFQCARLTVPMDYHRPLNAFKDNPKVHIAMVLVPGTHSGPKNFSVSPLLLNPGGPGGSGTLFAIAFGERIHKLVGMEQDVIGFDPRGVGATTPRADCFSYPSEESTTKDDEDYERGNFHRILWAQAGRQIGIVNSSAVALQKLDVRARTIAKLCESKDSLKGKDSIMKYVHTPSVARDMISIIDAWDEWTGSSTVHDSCKKPRKTSETGGATRTSNITDTKGKLVYWGFSYGTLLGATFAAMFPNRVGRIVLDGVVDSDLYVSPIWSDSIRDADAIMNSFSGYCHKAGQACDLYREDDQVADVESRFYGVLDDLKDNPITAIEPITRSPVIVTYSDVRLLLFSTLYSPTSLFPIVAYLVNLVYIGQGELIAQILSLPYAYDLKTTCDSPIPSWLYANEAQNAIMCSDKRYPLNETLPELEARFEKLSNQSSFGSVWMSVMLGCEGWKIKAVDPPMRWDDHPPHRQKPIKTSHPLLFISNTADPVTPLKAGVKMAKKFLNAGLIEQKSEGHCSIAAVSKCTIGKIRSYFTTGDVPPPPSVKSGEDWIKGNWTTCEANEWPFHPYDGDEFLAQGDGPEWAFDAASMTALKDMQDSFNQIKFWGQHEPLGDILKRLQPRINGL